MATNRRAGWLHAPTLAEDRRTLGLVRGWTETYYARAGERPGTVTVERRPEVEPEPVRVRGPVLGRRVS